MKTFYLATIKTEDCEEYKYGFNADPSERRLKKIFFEEYGETYLKTDWNNCISWKVEEIKIIEIT